jgi:hypothetical protein
MAVGGATWYFDGKIDDARIYKNRALTATEVLELYNYPPPTITTDGTLAAVNTTYGTASPSPTSFTVSGAYLTANLIVTPPAGYEVKKSTDSVYAGSLNLGSGTVPVTTIDVRLAATTAVGSYGGPGLPIVCSSVGATSQNVLTGVAASTVAPAALTITATVQQKTYGATLTAGPGYTAFTSGALQNGNTLTSVTVSYDDGDAAADAAATYTGAINITAAVGDNGFVTGNYDITYVDGTLTVVMPVRLVAAAEVQVDKQGPIGTAETHAPGATYDVTADYLNGDLFTIGAADGVLTFIAANPDNNVGDPPYYVEVTATSAGYTDKMLIKITVVAGPVAPGTIFMFR